jgi:hypothetical protein
MEIFAYGCYTVYNKKFYIVNSQRGNKLSITYFVLKCQKK